MIGLAAAKADQFIAVLLSKIGACVLVFGVLFLIGFLISLFLFLFFPDCLTQVSKTFGPSWVLITSRLCLNLLW